jgi:CHASE3 domain sensor protein
MSVFSLRTWTLRRRVVALSVTVALVLTMLGVFAAITAANSNRHIDIILDRTGPMRSAGESLSTAVVDQETGIRGYAISGEQDNLSPYNDGLAAQNRLLAEIDRLNAPTVTRRCGPRPRWCGSGPTSGGPSSRFRCSTPSATRGRRPARR